MKKFSIYILTIVCHLLLARQHCFATNYYVATNGNNSSAGTISVPFKTISYGVSKIQPGDTLFVRAGVYSESVLLTVSGTDAKKIVIKNYPGELPQLNGWTNGQLSGSGGIQTKNWAPASYVSNVVIEGFYITGYRWGGININWCSTCSPANGDNVGANIDIRYNIVDQCGQNGISVFFSTNVIIENNIASRTGWDSLSGSWSSGINLYAARGNCFVRNNVSFHHIDVSPYNSDGNGFILDLSYGFSNTVFSNNIAFANGGAGIVITRSSNTKLYNNTTCFNGHTNDAGDFSYVYKESFSNTTFVNNLGFNGIHGSLKQYQGLFDTCKTCTVSNNDLYPGSATAINPMVVDASLPDFHLQATSALIDAGRSNSLTTDNGFDQKAIRLTTGTKRFAWFTNEPDIDYITAKGGLIHCFNPSIRPQGNGFDIGAYEYTSPTITQTIQLIKGWNLISTNISTIDSSIATIFKTVDVQEVKTDECFWRKGQNTVFNSLKTIEAGKGYLVNMNSAATLSITGKPIVIRNSKFVINSTWNIIGCPYQTSTALSTIFISTNTIEVKDFEGFWIQSGNTNSIQNLDPGKGYFIKAK